MTPSLRYDEKQERWLVELWKASTDKEPIKRYLFKQEQEQFARDFYNGYSLAVSDLCPYMN